MFWGLDFLLLCLFGLWDGWRKEKENDNYTGDICWSCDWACCGGIGDWYSLSLPVDILLVHLMRK